MDIIFWLAIAVAAIAQPIDILSTIKILKQGGREANPFVLMLMMEDDPVFRWWLVKLLIAGTMIAIIVYLYTLAGPGAGKISVLVAAVLLAFFYTFVVTRNLWIASGVRYDSWE